MRHAVVLDHGLIGCLVHYRGWRGPLLILTEPTAVCSVVDLHHIQGQQHLLVTATR
jgi:hypothetical protein